MRKHRGRSPLPAPSRYWMLTSEQKSFTTPPILSGRFSHAASSQLYSYVPSIENLVTYLDQNICTTSDTACTARAQQLLSADYIDTDYDSISHALVLKAFWSKPHQMNSEWNELHLPSENGAMEVGVLINEKPDEDEELRYSGFLTQVGKDRHPCTFFLTPPPFPPN